MVYLPLGVDEAQGSSEDQHLQCAASLCAWGLIHGAH